MEHVVCTPHYWALRRSLIVVMHAGVPTYHAWAHCTELWLPAHQHLTQGMRFIANCQHPPPPVLRIRQPLPLATSSSAIDGPLCN